MLNKEFWVLNNWEYFSRRCPFLRSPVDSPHKNQWRDALTFSMTCIYGQSNNRGAGDMRRHRAHYDVAVVLPISWVSLSDAYYLVGCFDMAHTLQWRYIEHDGVSNHQRRDCLLNRLFKSRTKKISKLRVTGFCEGNSPVAVYWQCSKFCWNETSWRIKLSVWQQPTRVYKRGKCICGTICLRIV